MVRRSYTPIGSPSTPFAVHDNGDGTFGFAGSEPYTVQVTMLSGQSLSPAFNVDDADLRVIGMPAGWDAAPLTFQGTFDPAGATGFQDIYIDGTELSIPAAANRSVAISAENAFVLMAYTFIKIRSGPSASAVPQTADRIFTNRLMAL